MQQCSVQILFYNGVILSALSPPSGEMHMFPLLLELAFKAGNSSHTVSHPRFNVSEQAPYGKVRVMLKLHSSKEKTLGSFEQLL